MKWIILIFCVLNPLWYSYGIEARQAQEAFFQLSGLLVILSGLLFRPKYSSLEKGFNISLFAFFAWAVVLYSMLHLGLSVMLNIFIGMGVYFTVIRYLEKKDIEFIIKGLAVLMFFAIAYLFFQFIGFDMRGQQLRSVGGVPKCSFFALEACYGMYLAMVIPLLMSISFLNNVEIDFDKKSYLKNIGKFLLVGGYLLLLLAACWRGNSTGVFLGAFVGLLTYLWFRKRIFFWFVSIPALVLTLCFVFLYDSPMGMQRSRIDMWQKVIQDSHKRPLGHGLDSFRFADGEGAVRYFKFSFNNTTRRIVKTNNQWVLSGDTPKEFIERVNSGINPLDFWDNPHNEFIQVFYEMGFPGIIIVIFMLYFLFDIFRKCRRTPLSVGAFCSLLAVLIISLTQFPFHLSRNGSLIPVILGIFMVSVRDEND